jgi:hypothetical protein
LLYAACMAEHEQEGLSAAAAHRMSQAEKKDWQKYAKDIEQRIKKLVWPHLSEQKPKKDDKSLKNFFNALAKAKGKLR